MQQAQLTARDREGCAATNKLWALQAQTQGREGSALWQGLAVQCKTRSFCKKKKTKKKISAHPAPAPSHTPPRAAAAANRAQHSSPPQLLPSPPMAVSLDEPHVFQMSSSELQRKRHLGGDDPWDDGSAAVRQVPEPSRARASTPTDKSTVMGEPEQTQLEPHEEPQAEAQTQTQTQTQTQPPPPPPEHPHPHDAYPAAQPAANTPHHPPPSSDALLIQQEVTRQEYYRLEARQRSLQLFDQAVKYNVPAALIPLLFAGHPAELQPELDRLTHDAPVSLTSYAALVQAAASAAATVLQGGAGPSYPSAQSTPSQSVTAQAGAIAAAAASGVPPPMVPGTPQRTQDARLMSPLHKDSRMAFRHQRNLSMPAKPTDYGSQSPRRPFQFGQQPGQPPPGQQPMHPGAPPPPQPMLHPAPPIYSHSPSSIHTSPVRTSWPYYPQPAGKSSPPSSPQPVPPPGPSQSMHHIIQFHHWQPTRTPSNTKKEKEQKDKDKDKDKEKDKDKDREDSDSAPSSKRRRSYQPEGAPAAPTTSGPAATSGPAPATAAATAAPPYSAASASAQAATNRRKGHARHRSEASIRSDSFNRSLSYFQTGAAQGQGQGPQQGGPGTPGGTLASLSIPEYPYKTDPVSSERNTPNPQAKSHKHGVDFMIDKDENK